MNNFHKNLNIAFVGGLLGLVAMSFLGPKIVGMLLTAPVNFGINCEPDVTYSMQKLIVCQAVGLVLGVILTFYLRYKIWGGKSKSNATAS